MYKIDIISNCLECSWIVRKKKLCGYKQQEISLVGEAGFPAWCPLRGQETPAEIWTNEDEVAEIERQITNEKLHRK